MTFPSGKLDPFTWLAADAAARDAIGSSDAARVGDFCVLESDGSRYICLTVFGPDNSTWGLALPDDVAIDGNLNLPSNTAVLTIGSDTSNPQFNSNKADASQVFWNLFNVGARRWAWVFDTAEDNLLARYDAGEVFQDATTVDEAAGGWDFPAAVDITGLLTLDGDLTMGGSDPNLNVGSGAGSPEAALIKSDAGTAALRFIEGTDQFNLTYTAAESLVINRIIDGVFQEQTIIDGTDHGWTFPGAVEINGALNHDGSTVGLYAATPVVQHSSTGQTAGFTEVAGTNVTEATTFTGGVGGTAYTVGDCVKALKNIGLMAS